MEPETGTTLDASLASHRCEHCGGSVRDGAPWCTLCLTPTGAHEQQPFLDAPQAVDPLTAPLELVAPELVAPELVRTSRPRGKHAAPSDEDLAAWPCATCESPNPLDAAVCTTCGAGFLAAVAGTEPPLLVLPWLGDVSRLSKLHWAGIGVGLLLVLLAVIVGVGALLG